MPWNGLDLAHFFSAPGLAWQAASKKKKKKKKNRVKLDLLTDIDMLLMVGKRYQW